jgi:hypothetical protein
LAREVIALRDRYGWDADICCVPALLHNTPDRIPPAIEKRIRALRSQYQCVVVVYGDCGTSGALDDALDRLGVERIAGPHCYEQYGSTRYDQIVRDVPGTYFLTDFLARHFDRIAIHSSAMTTLPITSRWCTSRKPATTTSCSARPAPPPG